MPHTDTGNSVNGMAADVAAAQAPLDAQLGPPKKQSEVHVLGTSPKEITWNCSAEAVGGVGVCSAALTAVIAQNRGLLLATGVF